MVRIYAAGERAVATITDSDTKLTLEDRGARCLAVDPQDPDILYAGTTDEGIFKSEDGARSWERLSGVTHSRITALAISACGGGTVYAGTEPSSLFVSRDVEIPGGSLKVSETFLPRPPGAFRRGPGPPTSGRSHPLTKTRASSWPA